MIAKKKQFSFYPLKKNTLASNSNFTCNPNLRSERLPSITNNPHPGQRSAEGPLPSWYSYVPTAWRGNAAKFSPVQMRAFRGSGKNRSSSSAMKIYVTAGQTCAPLHLPQHRFLHPSPRLPADLVRDTQRMRLRNQFFFLLRGLLIAWLCTMEDASLAINSQLHRHAECTWLNLLAGSMLPLAIVTWTSRCIRTEQFHLELYTISEFLSISAIFAATFTNLKYTTSAQNNKGVKAALIPRFSQHFFDSVFIAFKLHLWYKRCHI